MTNFTATIYEQDGTTELLEDIVVRIQEEGGNIKSWKGEFESDKLILVGRYRIELDDGRSGDMIINKMSAGSHGQIRVAFQGSGPLS